MKEGGLDIQVVVAPSNCTTSGQGYRRTVYVAQRIVQIINNTTLRCQGHICGRCNRSDSQIPACLFDENILPGCCSYLS